MFSTRIKCWRIKKNGKTSTSWLCVSIIIKSDPSDPYKRSIETSKHPTKKTSTHQPKEIYFTWKKTNGLLEQKDRKPERARERGSISCLTFVTWRPVALFGTFSDNESLYYRVIISFSSRCLSLSLSLGNIFLLLLFSTLILFFFPFLFLVFCCCCNVWRPDSTAGLTMYIEDNRWGCRRR